MTLFKCCKIEAKQDIPVIITDDEKIVRTVFSPINLSKDQKSLKSNAFKPPADLDEISVNRLTYTTPDFCKLISKISERPENDRNYFGFALLYSKEIKDCRVELIYTRKSDNIYHADIKIGYAVKRGEQLPAEIQQKIDKLTQTARLFKDNNPLSDHWEGDNIE